MYDKIGQTLIDLNSLQKQNIKYILTRFLRNSKSEPDDLDILVKHKDFNIVIKLLSKQGYKSFSHDHALGGRIEGMQKNLVKDGRIKIDLHQDFTWKRSHYLDLEFIWNNLENSIVNRVNYSMPKVKIDIFIIAINIIFEKTYITKDDFNYINKYLPDIFQDVNFDIQAKKYGWLKTYQMFKEWFRSTEKKKFPVFLPVYLVLFSHIEKLFHDRKIDVISLMYYVFFRIRYEINGVLPYE